MEINQFIPQLKHVGFLGCYFRKHDNVWYELENWLRLLLKSNRTMLESLFIPQDKIIGEVHPYVQ